MKGDFQRKIVKLAALYKAVGMDCEEPLVKKHKKLFRDEVFSISSIMKNVIEIQQRGSCLSHKLKHSDFLDFKVVASLNCFTAKEAYDEANKPTNYLLMNCPLCSKNIPREELEAHIRHELLTLDNTRIRVTIDPSFGLSQKEAYFSAERGRELKELIYEKLAISVSSQELRINNRTIENKDRIDNPTVNLMYKRHYM